MSTTTAIRTQDFPRVNLLPGEIAEEQRFRSLRAIMALALVGAVGLVGGLWYMASQDVAVAEEELAAAQATNASLQAEVVKYQDVPKVYKAVELAGLAVDRAMGQEVRYSFVLNDLSLTIPSNVWLTSITMTQDVDGTAAVTSPEGVPGIGTLTVIGTGYKQNNTAQWLDSLTESDYYVDPYFSSSTLTDPVNNKDLVEFQSSVTVTDEAYSNRYTNETGN